MKKIVVIAAVLLFLLTVPSASAEWSGRAGHSSVAMPDGSIILMGGQEKSGLSSVLNDVWRSVDNGVTWTQQTTNARWSARTFHSSVAMPDGSIILMGGYDGDTWLNDVWRSTDNGVTWTQQAANAGWPAREWHASVAMPDGSIILMGGLGFGRFNDVWRSTDNGVTWTQQTANAGWPARYMHASVAMPDGSIILMGGEGDSGAFNDVWRSTDNGVTWTQQTMNAGWSARTSPSSIAMLDGSIILMGGYGDTRLNDVWRSTDNGVTWTQQAANAGWPARHMHASVAMPDGSIILMGGSGLLDDVWRSTDNGVTWTEQNPKAGLFLPIGLTLATGGLFIGVYSMMVRTKRKKTFKEIQEKKRQEAGSFVSKAKDLASGGRYLDAIKTVDQALALQSDNDELQRLRAKYVKSEAEDLASHDRYLAAIKTVDQALALQPDNDELQHLRAKYVNLHAQYVKSNEAKAEAKAAAKAKAKAEAKDIASRGRFLDAIEMVDQALALQPDNDELQRLRAKYVNLHAQYVKAEDLASRGRFPAAIETVDQALALQPDNDELQHLRAQYVKDEARRPDLQISLETTPLRLGSWQQISATLTNPGSADALGIGIALSDDFEVRRVDTCTVEASGSKTIEIPLLPKHGGHVPLDITLTYEDPWSRQYSTSEEFWIDVNDMTPFTHASQDTPVSPVSDFSPQPLTPKQFPTELAERYRDVSFIAKGGFGRVFRATRPDNIEVAVKIPLSLDAATGKSFIAELQSWTRLSHPNIVKLYDYNIMPIPYFEMEYCESALTDMEKPMAPREAAGIIFNICEGVKIAHNQRIIHRDLKPQNILIKNGVPKVSDWGLSRVVTESRTSTTTSFTAYYAAPEQINNTGKDERTDIWQIGVIFYELVTGVLPFTGESMVGVVSAITMENPQPPSEIVAESADVESIILKCLEKKLDNRFQSVLELQRELARYLEWNYSEELRNSISSGDSFQAACYCGELVMNALCTGDVSSAYKYLNDLLLLTKGSLRVNMQSLAEKVQFMKENDIEVSADIIEEAKLLIHQISSRR